MSDRRSLLNTLMVKPGAALLALGLSFGALADSPASPANSALEAKADAVSAARMVMEDFMTTFNARDEAAWAGTFNYPHVRFASGQVRISDDMADVMREMDFDKFAEATGWHHSAWDSIELVAAGPQKVHFAVSFTRYNEAGQKLKTYQSLYIVTLKDGHWGILARSSFAP